MKEYVSNLCLAIKFNEDHKSGFYSSSQQGYLKAIPASGRIDRYASRTVDNSTPEEFTVNGIPFDANNGIMIGKGRYAFKQQDRGLFLLQLPEDIPQGVHADLLTLENGEVVTVFLWHGTCSLGVKSSHISKFGPE